MNPVSQMSAIRPSMMTLVSRMRYRRRGPVSRNRLTMRSGSSHSELRAPITRPMYGETEEDEAVQEDDAMIVDVSPVERRADGLGRAETDGAAKEAPQHVRHRDVLETLLEEDDERAKSQAKAQAGEADRRRAGEVGRRNTLPP
jgi:hypothetical protein